MAQMFEPDPTQPDAAARAIGAAVEALTRGALVVFPTETVYGIACRADVHDATADLFAAKGRPFDLALPVMAATAAEALSLGEPNAVADALADAFWPGRLTMVLRRGERAAGWSLGAREDTIALRLPNHPVALAVLARAGPLAVSSANLSGSDPAATSRELFEAFGERVAVYLTQAEPLDPAIHPPSTVVDVSDGRPRILRHGELTEDVIRSALVRTSPPRYSID
jgi:tRNA threonylcarbamoyl adenosine modification protein (Sua5/YciO/YrdC/YwlC family)